MRAPDYIRVTEESEILCGECEQRTSSYVTARGAGGASIYLCNDCVAAYYIACETCGGVFPQDEARTRDKLSLCAECFSKPAGAAQTEEVNEPLDALVAEYVALHAEEKRIKGQMEALKERLKKAAEGMPRAGGAVTLRAGDEAVRCSYRTKLKCEDTAVERLADMLAPEEFARLFERKLSFNPHEDEIKEFLSSADEERKEARDLLGAAVRETETVMLTVVPPRK